MSQCVEDSAPLFTARVHTSYIPTYICRYPTRFERPEWYGIWFYHHYPPNHPQPTTIPKPCLIKAASAAFWASSKVPPWRMTDPPVRFDLQFYKNKLYTFKKWSKNMKIAEAWGDIMSGYLMFFLPFQSVFHARISDAGFHISNQPLTKKAWPYRETCPIFSGENLPNRSQQNTSQFEAW